jgi:hypothetical protein
LGSSKLKIEMLLDDVWCCTRCYGMFQSKEFYSVYVAYHRNRETGMEQKEYSNSHVMTCRISTIASLYL